MGVKSAALLFLAAASARAEPSYEWQAVLYEGHQIGHVEIVRDVEPDGVRTYDESIVLSLMLGGRRHRVDVVTAYREDADGAPLSMRRTQPRDDRATTVAIEADALAIVRRAGRDTERTRVARPDDLRFPPALHADVAALLARGSGSLHATVLHPSSLRPIALTIEVADPVRRTVRVQRGGRRPQVLAWPFDAARLEPPLRMLGLTLQRERCTSMCAQLDTEFDPMSDLLVRSPYRLPLAALHGRIRYALQDAGDALEGLPSGVEQQVDVRGGRTIVTVCATCDGAEAPPDDLAPYLRVDDPWIDATDPQVRSLARSARAHGGTIERRMRNLATAVRAHMDGPIDFGGYLTASEAVRERGGDCTEFALLLAAVGRVHGIPTRIVSGIAYASRYSADRNVFTPHMWVQAWTGTRWQSFDAALEQYDAGHIALSVGSGDPAEHAHAMQRLRTSRVVAAGALPL